MVSIRQQIRAYTDDTVASRRWRGQRSSREKKAAESNRRPDALYIEAEPRGADSPWRLNIDEMQRGVSRVRARARATEKERSGEREEKEKEKERDTHVTYVRTKRIRKDVKR